MKEKNGQNCRNCRRLVCVERSLGGSGKGHDHGVLCQGFVFPKYFHFSFPQGTLLGPCATWSPLFCSHFAIYGTLGVDCSIKSQWNLELRRLNYEHPPTSSWQILISKLRIQLNSQDLLKSALKGKGKAWEIGQKSHEKGPKLDRRSL